MFLSHEQLQERGIRLSERQLRRLEAEGKFPRRIHLSTYRVAWDAGEIERWCEERRAARELASVLTGEALPVRGPISDPDPVRRE